MSSQLAVQDLIAVTLNLTPAGASAPNLSSFLIIGDSNIINTKQRFLTFTSLTAVQAVFGGSAPETLAAGVFFGQNPAPSLLGIGRWAKTATAGLLLGGALTATQQAMSNWTTITAGEFKIAVDGGSATNVTCGTFAAQTNLNGVAAVIQTAVQALGGMFAAVTCTWNGSQFQFVSGTTGTSSAIAPLTTGTASDISAQLLCTAATDTYTVAGIAAESAIACVTLFDTQIPISFFGLNFAAGTNNADIADSDHLAIAAYVEGGAGKHLYGLTTAEAAAITSTDSTSVGYQLKQLGYNWTFYQYSSQNPYASCSLFGLGVTINFTGINTTIDFMWKQEPGVIPEALTEAQSAALQTNNYNFYATYNNGIPITQNGQVASGQYIDTLWNCAWLKGAVQANMFNILFQNNKVPQTDPGMQQLAAGAAAACQQGVTNGMLAPGTWTAGNFGQILTGQFLSKGYAIFVPPVASQASGSRAARQSVAFQIGAKLAGAVNTASILIDVNP